MGNAYAIAARETGGWGVIPSSGWRDHEPSAVALERQSETLQHRGLRPIGGAPRASGRRQVKAKGAGSLTVPAHSNGLGTYLWAAGTTTSSTQTGTLAYTQEYEFGAGPALDRSICVETYVDRYSTGTYDVWTYPGLRITQTELGQSTDGFLDFTFTFDGLPPFRMSDNPGRSVTTVDADLIYAWPDAEISVVAAGGTPVAYDWSSFGLTLPVNLNTDSWTLRRGTAEVQTLTKGGTWSGGTYTITITIGGNAVTTAAIAYNANAAAVQTAIETAGVPTGYVTVTGGPLSTTALTFTYAADLGDVGQVSADVTSVTGSTPTVTPATGTAGVRRGRRQPKVTGTPAPTGTLMWDYDGPQFYDAWWKDQEFELTATWQGRTAIEGTTYPGLTITVPSLFFTGSAPSLDMDNPNQQSLPFEITDNGTDAPATLEFVTSDADY